MLIQEGVCLASVSVRRHDAGVEVGDGDVVPPGAMAPRRDLLVSRRRKLLVVRQRLERLRRVLTRRPAWSGGSVFGVRLGGPDDGDVARLLPRLGHLLAHVEGHAIAVVQHAVLLRELRMHWSRRLLAQAQRGR
eukprot:gene1820-biopygen16873